MENPIQYLIEEVENQITQKEQEIEESNNEDAILNAKLKMEKKILNMKDIPVHLKEDFEYSVQAIEGMSSMEGEKNKELKKELEMLKYRKAVIESQFSDGGLDFER